MDAKVPPNEAVVKATGVDKLGLALNAININRYKANKTKLKKFGSIVTT